jgi:hypothetical protein
MKKVFLWLAVSCAALVPGVKAQEPGNIQVGAFADYYRSEATGTNMFGVGGRLGFGILPHTMLEGELAYDFTQEYTSGFNNTSNGSISFYNTGVRTLHGLFGPRVILGHGPVRPFLEVKGGFINYMFDGAPPGYNAFANQVANLRAQNMNAALLAGGGVEGKVGPLGLRLDVSDEMYFNHGTHNGLKVMFGPFLRF